MNRPSLIDHPSTMQAAIVVREVWQSDLNAEFNHILQCVTQFPYISIDTEFPGIIYNPTDIPSYLFSSLSPSHLYSIMKRNVDNLHLIQLGLTLSDAHGAQQYVWQFNFRDFDCDRDRQNKESISLLKKQGIDFVKNMKKGINSSEFAAHFKQSALGRCSLFAQQNQTWITFHGLYHFGFLIKILTGRRLPDNLGGFMIMVELYFGLAVYDLKPMAQAFGLQGGLGRIAKSLNLERGKSYQAGADSLLTMQVFMELKKKNYFTPPIMERFNHQIYGLTPFRPMVLRNYCPVPMVIYQESSNNKIEETC